MSNEYDTCIACGKPCESGQNECHECRAELGRQCRAWLRGDTDNAWAWIMEVFSENETPY